jgi:hypothetical protein
MRILLVLLVTGCAQPPYWVKTWDGALETQVVLVDQSPWGDNVGGWTVCDKTARKCTILISRAADYDCVKRHEEKHAAGFDHPDYRQGFICQR